jgi:hypothetical protein
MADADEMSDLRRMKVKTSQIMAWQAGTTRTKMHFEWQSEQRDNFGHETIFMQINSSKASERDFS